MARMISCLVELVGNGWVGVDVYTTAVYRRFLDAELLTCSVVAVLNSVREHEIQ